MAALSLFTQKTGGNPYEPLPRQRTRGIPAQTVPYAIIRIASDRRYRDREGNKLTDFVSVKVRGNLAELCVEHLKKGDKIAATGDFETISAPDENGVMRQTGFLIKANDIQFLSPKPEAETEEAAV